MSSNLPSHKREADKNDQPDLLPATNAASPILIPPRSRSRGLILGLVVGAAGLAIVCLLLAVLGVGGVATQLQFVGGSASQAAPIAASTSQVQLAQAPTAAPSSSPTFDALSTLAAVLPSPSVATATSTVPPTVPLPTDTVPAATSSVACLKPQIASFTINPTAIKRGDTAMLNWGAVTNATRADIDQGIGGVPSPGSHQVKPDRDTTFTLTATGCGGVTTAQVSISVLPFGVGDPGIPQGPQTAQKFLQFDWSNRSTFNSDYLSGIEIQTNRSGSYQPFESAQNFPDGQYTNKKAFPTNGKYKIRFRWWMIDPKTHQPVSLKSQWSVICFNYGDNEPCN